MSESLNTDQSFIRKLTAIIQANQGNENFGAKELAHESGMSLYRLNRRLHSINGKTSSRFIREVRLQKAQELLQNEAYTVSEVAFKTGFSSPSYFMKGQYYNVNGQSSEALVYYNKALEINPNYYQVYYRKGNLLTRVLGDYVKGLDNYHQALNLIRGEGRPVILKSLESILSPLHRVS